MEKTRTNPFPGLRPFEVDETHLFFGRNGQSAAIVEKLEGTRFVGVVGTSGSGKSSLVRAGLLPQLDGGLMASVGSSWRFAVMKPGDTPLGNLARELAKPHVLGEGAANTEARAAQIEAVLRRGSLGLVEATQQARLSADENLLVVVDQFEELFRMVRLPEAGAVDEAAAFVAMLLEAARQTEHAIYVVLIMRSDFLGECSRFRDLPEALNRSQYLVPRMSRDELRSTIEGPVAVGAATITPRLVQELLNEVGDDPDHLPVLQHALMRTWDTWASDGNFETPLDLAHFSRVGALKTALSDHADEVMKELTDRQKSLALPGLGPVVERVFRNLTERLEGPGSEVRRPMHFERLCRVTGDPRGDVAQVVERFRRPDTVFLLPTVGVPLADDPLIDISHESLIRGWTSLATWAEREAQSAQVYRRLAAAAAPVGDTEPASLQDPFLQFALDWRQQNSPNVHWAEQYDPGFERAMSFLERSARERQTARDQAARAAQRKRQVRWIAAMVSVGVTVVMGVLWRRSEAALVELRESKALVEKSKALEQAHNESRGLALAADQRLDLRRFDSALILSAAAMQGEAAPESQEIMRRVMLNAPTMILRDDRFAKAHDSGMINFGVLEFSPDTKRLLAMSSKGEPLLWDLAARSRVALVRPADEGVHKPMAGFDGDGTLWFTPDARGCTAAVATSDKCMPLEGLGDGLGNDTLRDSASLGTSLDAPRHRLARIERDGDIRVWDLRSGLLLAELPTTRDDASQLQFSADGRWLVAWQPRGALRVWDLEDKRPRPRPRVVIPDAGHAMALSRDGRSIATASRSGVTVREILRPAAVRRLPATGSSVEVLAFGADGRTLAWGQADGKVVRWDLSGGIARAQIDRPHGSSGVSTLVFSPDGQQLASGGADGVLALWWSQDATSMRRVVWGERIDRLTYSGDGRLVASAHRDGLLLLHDAAMSKARHGEFRPLLDAIPALAFDPAGDRLALASEDASVQFWDLRKGVLRGTPLRGHEKPLTSLAYSRDGKLLASGGADHKIRLWAVGTGERVPIDMVGHKDRVNALAFAPEGKKLLASVGDTQVIIWDLGTGRHRWKAVADGDEVLSVAFSPSGESVATAGRGGFIRLWDVATGQRRWERAQGREIFALAFSPDGNTIAAAAGVRQSGGSKGAILLRSAASGDNASEIDVPGEAVRSIAYDHGGARIASGATDGMVRLWDARTLMALAQPFEGHDTLITAVAFSPDGTSIASVGADLRLILWEADVASWPRRACHIVPFSTWPADWPRALSDEAKRRGVCRN